MSTGRSPVDDDQTRADQPDSQTNPDDAPEPPKPSARARYTILLIGALAIGSIGCMCAFIFTIALTM